MSNGTDKCATCKFVVVRQGIRHECHRLPKVYTHGYTDKYGIQISIWTWPPVEPDEWCGEWKPQDPKS